MKDYILAFLIGSNAFLSIPFISIVFKNIDIINFNFHHYLIASPLGFGIMNLICILLYKKLKINIFLFYSIISIISALVLTLVESQIKLYNIDNLNTVEFLRKVILRMFSYIAVFLFIGPLNYYLIL